MATYKVWLTVKDSYGHIKEVDGGTINLDLDLNKLSSEDIAQLEEALPLEDYLKKSEIDTELNYYATDVEVEHAVNTVEAIKYSSFELLDETEKEGE